MKSHQRLRPQIFNDGYRAPQMVASKLTQHVSYQLCAPCYPQLSCTSQSVSMHLLKSSMRDTGVEDSKTNARQYASIHDLQSEFKMNFPLCGRRAISEVV